jgi:uncharacterized protein YndB with AHSA1/START domain
MDQLAYFVERHFPVSRERLWDAWTVASELEQWYCPEGLAVVPGSVVSEPHVGGRWAVAVDVQPLGFVAYFFGRYTEVTAPTRLVHTLHYSEDEATFRKEEDTSDYHQVEVTLLATPEGCVARYSQWGQMDPEEAAQAEAGMGDYFAHLATYLERSNAR